MQIDQVIRSKRKTIGIEVQPGGKVIVRAPLHTSDAALFALLQKRADWIRKAKSKMEKLDIARQPNLFREGDLFWHLGKQYPLHLSTGAGKPLTFSASRGFTLAQKALPQAEKHFIDFYRDQTRHLVTQFIQQYQPNYGFKVGNLRITSARTRWGSCSANNNLNFTYRLAMVPLSAIEYVVVHELVHTRVKNHSTQFWQQVSVILPGWKKERAWLHQQGSRLNF